jgi:hypothetical protein
MASPEAEPGRFKKLLWFLISHAEAFQQGLGEYRRHLRHLDEQFLVAYPQSPASHWKQTHAPRWATPHKLPRRMRRTVRRTDRMAQAPQ